jgi:hypothetical protein
MAARSGLLCPPRDVTSAALGVASLAWVPLSLWPHAAVSAWPGASLGLLALALAVFWGRIGPRMLGTLAGTCGVLLGSGQIAVLWGVAILAQ